MNKGANITQRTQVLEMAKNGSSNQLIADEFGFTEKYVGELVAHWTKTKKVEVVEAPKEPKKKKKKLFNSSEE